MNGYGNQYGGGGYGYEQPQHYQNQFNPMADGYGDELGNGQNIGRALSQGAALANSLSSQNAQASYYPQAMVQQSQLALQLEQLKQQGQNQRLGSIAPLFAALFGAGGSASSGGHGGGFTSNFGQSVK